MVLEPGRPAHLCPDWLCGLEPRPDWWPCDSNECLPWIQNSGTMTGTW